ncbi:hypothetical protein OAO87_01880, partial [bacterium]|nr:hypothetical protein [bacterium]
ASTVRAYCSNPGGSRLVALSPPVSALLEHSAAARSAPPLATASPPPLSRALLASRPYPTSRPASSRSASTPARSALPPLVATRSRTPAPAHAAPLAPVSHALPCCEAARDTAAALDHRADVHLAAIARYPPSPSQGSAPQLPCLRPSELSRPVVRRNVEHSVEANSATSLRHTSHTHRTRTFASIHRRVVIHSPPRPSSAQRIDIYI